MLVNEMINGFNFFFFNTVIYCFNLISKLLIIKLLIAFDHAVIKFQIQLNRNKEIDISATYNLYISK